MGVSLAKGGSVSLDKSGVGFDLSKAAVALGWNPRVTDGPNYDLDASALMLNVLGKVLSDGHFVFYNNLLSPDKTVRHTGDNLTGEGDGDDEVVDVDLDQVPANVERIVFAVTIHDAEKRKQSFGNIANAFIRVIDRVTGQELTRYDLGEEFSIETGLLFGDLCRSGEKWVFNALGQSCSGGLLGIAKSYGVNVD